MTQLASLPSVGVGAESLAAPHSPHAFSAAVIPVPFSLVSSSPPRAPVFDQRAMQASVAEPHAESVSPTRFGVSCTPDTVDLLRGRLAFPARHRLAAPSTSVSPPPCPGHFTNASTEASTPMTPPSPANSPVRGRLSHRNTSRRLRAPSLPPSPPSCTPRMTPAERALPPLLSTQPSTDSQAAEDPPRTPPEPRAHALTANVLPGDTLSADPVPDSETAVVPATASPTVPPPRPHAPTVRSVFHLSQRGFACSLCPPSSFTSWCALATHRRSCHRHTLFVDKFVAACACARVFDARLAAALHGRSCGPRRTPPPSRSPGTAIPRRRLSHFGGTTKPKVAPLTHVLPSPNAPDDGAVAS
ncbi:unnamed protein product, partial [Aphanomyces euteiches]